METALENQGEQHGLHHVVLVMGVGDLVAARLLDGLIEGALSHFRAEGAGIAFLSHLKYHLIDIRLYNRVMDAHFLAERLNRAQIKAREAQIHRNRFDFKGSGVEALQAVQGVEHGQAVLSARNSHGNLIPGLYHMKIVHGAPRVA